MSLLVEVLLGLYLGLLTGIVPALVAGGLGFIFKYVTGVTLPGLGVVVLSVAIAGVSGGLLGLIDPAITASPRLMVALLVVMMLSMYAHNEGDQLGARLPRRFSFRSLGTRTLSGDVIFNVGGIGRVSIEPRGEVDDIEGYPPLSPELRGELAAGRWEFPADVPIGELERRLEERLRGAYDLTEVDVTIDSAGRARIAAAPPLGSLSRRVPAGKRAVSIDALLPTGVARGERVALHLPDDRITGTVVSARSDPTDEPPAVPDGGAEMPGHTPGASTAPKTTGGEGRVTVAVDPEAARQVLAHARARVVVLPRGLGLEHEVVERLREAGNEFGRLSIAPDHAGRTLGDVAGTDGVTVLALHRHVRGRESARRDWTIAPDATATLAVGDQLIATGPPDAIADLEERLA